MVTTAMVVSPSGTCVPIPGCLHRRLTVTWRLPCVAHSLPGDQDRIRIQLSRHTETGARISLPKSEWLQSRATHRPGRNPQPLAPSVVVPNLDDGRCARCSTGLG